MAQDTNAIAAASLAKLVYNLQMMALTDQVKKDARDITGIEKEILGPKISKGAD